MVGHKFKCISEEKCICMNKEHISFAYYHHKQDDFPCILGREDVDYWVTLAPLVTKICMFIASFVYLSYSEKQSLIFFNRSRDICTLFESGTKESFLLIQRPTLPLWEMEIRNKRKWTGFRTFIETEDKLLRFT